MKLTACVCSRVAQLALLLFVGAPGPRAQSSALEHLRAWSQVPGVRVLPEGGAEHGALERAAAQAAQRFERELGTTPAGAQPQDCARLLVRLCAAGSAAQEAGLYESLGIEFPKGGGFRFQKRDYLGAADALIATLADPHSPGRPLTLLLGNDELCLALFLARLELGSRPHVALYRQGELERSAQLDWSGALLASTWVETSKALSERWRGNPPLDSRGFALSLPADLVPLQLELLEAQLERAARARSLTNAWAQEPQAKPPGLRWLVCRDAAELYAISGQCAPADCGPAALTIRARIASLGESAGFCESATARAQAQVLLGPPAASWMLEGAAWSVASDYWGVPLATWQAQLLANTERPALEQLLDERCPRSPHLLAPLRALLWQCLADNGKPAGLRALWRGESALPERAQLEAWWQASCTKLLEEQALELERLRARWRTGDAALEPRRGVVLCADPERIEGLLVSEQLELALEPLHERGANALLVPLFLCAPRPLLDPGSTNFVQSWPKGAISDAALLQLAQRARAMGLASLSLELHWLSASTASWDGERVLTRPAEWEACFESLEAASEHLALLGRLCGADLLLLSGASPGLARTEPALGTQERPLDREIYDLKFRLWQQWTARTRQTFAGPLAYAAEWGAQAESLELWPLLDVLALELFTPLWADEDQAGPPSREALAAAYGRALCGARELAQAQQRPLLISAVGATSSERPWSTPWVARGGVSEKLQALQLGALADALALESQAPQLGFFLWSWSPDPHAGGSEDSGFTPQNKLAQAVLGELFQAR